MGFGSSIARAAIAEQRVAMLFRLALALMTMAALSMLGWLAIAPNRLLPGVPRPAHEIVGAAAYALAAFALISALAAGQGRRLAWLGMILAAAALLAAPILTGWRAGELVAGRPIARATFGAGFWLAAACLLLLALEAARATGSAAARPLLALIIVGGAATAAAAGWFAPLSLAVEYRSRADALERAFVEHLALSGGALLLAIAVAVPLGWTAFRVPRLEATFAGTFNAIQVTPALALFGLLVSALSLVLAAAPGLRAYGISAIGVAPALIAVAAYLTLPLFRSTLTGLSSVSPAAVESARAMGMTEARVTREVRVPLGLPIFLGGLRVAAVQAIGLTTLGGLIGAGGLGSIVFAGMSQFAEDLIVLGAAPIVGLAILVDAAMRAISQRMEAIG